MSSHRHRSRTGTDPASNRPMSLSEIKESYAEYADWIHRFDWLARLVTGRYRRAQFGDVDGKILDVACGTGTNFGYLPETSELVGIDISPEMLARAEDRLAELAIDGTLLQMDAQDLDFADDSFDAVISSLSTCTFPDPVAALREMNRVCKPGGTIRLVEHGRSGRGTDRKLSEVADRRSLQPDRLSLDQQPRDIVAEAGLTVHNTTTGLLGMITLSRSPQAAVMNNGCVASKTVEWLVAGGHLTVLGALIRFRGWTFLLAGYDETSRVPDDVAQQVAGNTVLRVGIAVFASVSSPL
ncbi:class I SAM-dependent methyltransferase [Halobellus limi]|uniref:class I SAM-dependent methyltransferase n=1 Tax=Halobellus limi TaxID=699433 RepID=UPI001F0D976C|nr:class I SAM-dependent methyltransferase [Halobellus limi]